MLQPWKDSRSTPDVFEAGLTALAQLVYKEQLLVILRDAGVDLDAAILMALGQQSDQFSDEVSQIILDVERASDAELRGATLLIGLSRAPDSLFSNRFPVSSVIGDLNTHENSIIAQYSYWAVVEHPHLEFGNTRVSPSDFTKMPPNVQRWAYQALTKDGNTAFAHYDAIVEGSQSNFSGVREGVAVGLRDIYYDSLDVTVADWLIEEQSPAVREKLLEHMAVHVTKSSAYREEVLKAYRDAGTGSLLRSRLEAANHDNDVALEMRRIAFQAADPDLFAKILGPTMNQHFHGNVTAGGISNSGTGNSGTVRILTKAEVHSQIVPLLQQILKELQTASGPVAATGTEIAKEALSEPTKGKVAKLVDWLKTVKEGGDAAQSIIGFARLSYEKLAPLVENLPNLL